MPSLLLIKGFRFFFYSNENNEPVHIHISKGDAEGKVWLEPIIEVAYLHNFSKAEQKEVLDLIRNHEEQFKNKWNEYFKK